MLVYICSSAIYPRDIVNESNSEPGKEYITVTPTLFNEAICTCPGFYFRDTCKHIKEFEHVCTWHMPFMDGDPDKAKQERILVCPDCGLDVEIYETDPKDFDL